MAGTSLPPVLNLISWECMHDKSRYFRCFGVTTSKHPNNHQHNFSDAKNEALSTALRERAWILLMECFTLPIKHTTDTSRAPIKPENQLCKVCSWVRKWRAVAFSLKYRCMFTHYWWRGGEGRERWRLKSCKTFPQLCSCSVYHSSTSKIFIFS